jgi:hypothetical protein
MRFIIESEIVSIKSVPEGHVDQGQRLGGQRRTATSLGLAPPELRVGAVTVRGGRDRGRTATSAGLAPPEVRSDLVRALGAPGAEHLG